MFSSNIDENAVYLIYDGNNGRRIPDFTKVDVKTLKGDGDFRSPECIELLKQSDIVVTNPPFSLFREYIAQLVHYDKKFIVIGNKNSVTYKEIFPLIKDNKMWLGAHSWAKDMLFDVPKDSVEQILDEGKAGSKYRIVNGVLKRRSPSVWFTNLDHKKRHEELILYRKYTPEEYPKFDNYDAINVNSVTEIPCDYFGVMGVPISFLDKYNPEQFEIVEFRKGKDGKDLIYSSSGGAGYSHTSEYLSGDVDRRIDEQSQRYHNTGQEQICQDSYSATAIPGVLNHPKETLLNGKHTYKRILIRKIIH